MTRMWGGCAFFGPESGALLDAETVLFVDDDKPEVRKLHAVLDQRMGADQDVDFARGDSIEGFSALAGFRGAGKDGDRTSMPSSILRMVAKCWRRGSRWGPSCRPGIRCRRPAAWTSGPRGFSRFRRHPAAGGSSGIPRRYPCGSRGSRASGRRSGGRGVFSWVEGVEDASDLGEEESVAFREPGRSPLLDVELDA